MKFRKNWISLVLILSLFLVAGCSDDDKPTEPKDEPPQFAAQSVTVPQSMQTSSDPHAQQALGYVYMANSMANYISFLTPQTSGSLKKANDDSPWEYHWDIDGVTVTLTISETSDIYQWTVVLNGTDTETGQVFDNLTIIEVEQKKDGTNGEMILYDDAIASAKVAEWKWNVISETSVNYEIIGYYQGIAEEKIEILANSDNSGTLNYFDYINNAFVKMTTFSWLAIGSGQWWEYDTDGNETASGSW